MAISLLEVDLAPHVRALFTGRDPMLRPRVGAPGNISHRRPHHPGDLARTRREVAAVTGVDVDRWHFLDQVHGAEVAVIDGDTPPGTESSNADAAVTDLPGRALVVQVADCVPVLLAGSRAVGVAHAGRRGLAGGVVEAAIGALLAIDPGPVSAVVGPAIGGCCYEVPPGLQQEVMDRYPVAEATTTWGTPSLDLPRAVTSVLRSAGVEVSDVESCTRCSPGWFSHRADPGTGRFAGLITLREQGRA